MSVDPIAPVQAVGLIPANTMQIQAITPLKNGEGEEVQISRVMTDSNGNVLSISNTVLEIYTYQAKHLFIHPQSRGELV